jgi:hypothetical protein
MQTTLGAFSADLISQDESKDWLNSVPGCQKSWRRQEKTHDCCNAAFAENRTVIAYPFPARRRTLKPFRPYFSYIIFSSANGKSIMFRFMSGETGPPEGDSPSTRGYPPEGKVSNRSQGRSTMKFLDPISTR